ncbi:MAG: choice-of-anchor J domain-containing protein [Muribaculaceae bacterium]|nr:choice-of-anchor J domain-containing protein [Muribaculaceae bacterium]
MKKQFIALSVMAVAAVCGASAHSVALHTDFDNEYTEEFPVSLDLDHLPPFDNFRTIFTDGNGVARPWWPVKDSGAAQDRAMCSHSGYNVQGGGKSNDWLISRAIEIPTEGYTLSFGAQSFVMRTDQRRLSDLWVFITDYQPSENRLPEEPTMHLEQVSEGKYPNLLEKDFTYYELPLDKYAGKTIYISFANLNTDKDILAIDNVLVQRLDKAELSASSKRYVEAGSFDVDVVFKNTSDTPLSDWVLEFNPGNGTTPSVIKGETLQPGEEISRQLSAEIAADITCNWKVSLSASAMPAIEANGTITGLAFIPWHNVLVEEATGLWCGNCPIGIYALENIMEHPEMKEYTIPVSVHITQMGNLSDDYMTDENYAYMLGLTAAPTVRVDRGLRVAQFSLADDGLPVDFDNPRQFATLVKAAHEQAALMDVDVEGDFNIVDGDTVSINATVRLRPAMTLKGSSYRIGFSLTENNVGLESSRYWVQQNYLSGKELVSDFGGFTSLPQRIYGWRFMDVARGVFDFHGIDQIKLSDTMEMGEEYSFTVEIPIPDTYKEIERNGVISQVAPAVVAANLTLVAFVLEPEESFKAHNSASFAMTEQAEKRLSIAQQVQMASVEEIGMTPVNSATPEYFTLQGIKVEKPMRGFIYIVKRGNTVQKELIK